jgi:hypothetical protein
MAESLAELFDGGADFDLCDRLFVRVCEVHGNGADASSLPEEERTAYLVWGALGVVGNGGFRFLFEADVPGDPQYALTRRAFEAIGCPQAAGALGQALTAFPGGRVPADPSKRIREYRRGMPSFPSEADRAFFAAQGAITQGLANWIRARRQSFLHLL